MSCLAGAVLCYIALILLRSAHVTTIFELTFFSAACPSVTERSWMQFACSCITALAKTQKSPRDEIHISEP